MKKEIDLSLVKFDREFFLDVIMKWKFYWMEQTQNSKEDYENYRHRAFGVDANMKHSLADRLVSAIDAAMEATKAKGE